MGIKLSCKIKVKNNYKRIENIQHKLPETNQKSIRDVLKNIRGYAIRFERGHNSRGIQIELVNVNTGEIKGRVYTDKNTMPYALFEHFGTGRYAEMDHVGNSKHFLETGYEEWYIPVAKVDRLLNFPIVEIYKQKFYVATGSKANHFMTDAEFKSRQQNNEIFIKNLKEMIKECCS